MVYVPDHPPLAAQVWPSAMFGFFVHVFAAAKYPDFSYEQSWDGPNFNVQDSMGGRGTISWSGDRFVGAFFLRDSERNPYPEDADYQLAPRLAGLPVDLLPLAHEQTLQYLLQKYRKQVQPIITAAFWSDGKSPYLQSAEPWPLVFEHGASLVQRQLLTPSETLDDWVEHAELTPEEVDVVRALHARKIADPKAELTLTPREREVIEAACDGEEGWEAACESLGEVGIFVD